MKEYKITYNRIDRIDTRKMTGYYAGSTKEMAIEKCKSWTKSYTGITPEILKVTPL